MHYFQDRKFAGSVVALTQEEIAAAFGGLNEAPTFRMSRHAQLVLPSNEAAQQLFAQMGIAALGAERSFAQGVASWNNGTGEYGLKYRNNAFAFYKAGETARANIAIAIPLDAQAAEKIEAHYARPEVEGHFHAVRNQTVLARLGSQNPEYHAPMAPAQFVNRLREEPADEMILSQSAERIVKRVGTAVVLTGLVASAFTLFGRQGNDIQPISHGGALSPAWEEPLERKSQPVKVTVPQHESRPRAEAIRAGVTLKPDAISTVSIKNIKTRKPAINR